jgi:hypothetical protein
MFCHQDKTSKRRGLLRLLCIWAMMFVAGCELPQKPGDMWWDVDLYVPFGVRTYGVWDLVDADSTLRGVGSGVGMEDDSSVYFSAWSTISAPVADSLYIKPLDLQILRFVNAIQAPLEIDSVLQFTLGRMNSDVAALHGTTQDVPSHELEAQMRLALPAGYDSLVVDTGRVRLVIANRLPYSVSNLELTAGDKVVATIPTLAVDGQRVLDAMLDDAVIKAFFDVTLHATGDGGTSISVDSTARIAVTLVVDTVTASHFYGITPEQDVTRDSMMALNQQHDIDVAIIESGHLNITLSNQSQFADTVRLRLPNLVSRLNDTLVVTRFLQPGDSDVISVSLEQYRLRPEGETEQTVLGELISHTPAGTGRSTFISGEERVYARLQFERLPLEYFAGTLHNLELPLDTLEITIERPPQGWNVLRPLDVEARAVVERGIGGVMEATIDATTSLEGEQISEQTIAVHALPLVQDSSEVIRGLAALLADYPDKLVTHGNSSITGDVALYNNSVVQFALELRAALAVVMTDTLQPIGTVEKVDSKDLEDIERGEATVKVWNHLPVGGRIFLVADHDSSSVLENSGADVDTLYDVEIPWPTMEHGRTIEAGVSQFEILLTDRWLDYFKSGGFYTRTQLISTTGVGDTLVVHGGDYLKVQVIAKLVYTVDPGEIE